MTSEIARASRQGAENPRQTSRIVDLERGRERFSWRRVALVALGLGIGIGAGFLIGEQVGGFVDSIVRNPALSYQAMGSMVGSLVGGVGISYAFERASASFGF